METAFSIITGLALALGFAAAAAAFYGRYRVLPAFLTGPQVCKLEAGGCQILFRSPQAALLGPPNSLLGLFYYPALGLGLALGWPVLLLWLGAFAAGLMSSVLAFILLKNQLECRICWLGHACNTVLLAALTFKACGR